MNAIGTQSPAAIKRAPEGHTTVIDFGTTRVKVYPPEEATRVKIGFSIVSADGEIVMHVPPMKGGVVTVDLWPASFPLAPVTSGLTFNTEQLQPMIKIDSMLSSMLRENLELQDVRAVSISLLCQLKAALEKAAVDLTMPGEMRKALMKANRHGMSIWIEMSSWPDDVRRQREAEAYRGRAATCEDMAKDMANYTGEIPHQEGEETAL